LEKYNFLHPNNRLVLHKEALFPSLTIGMSVAPEGETRAASSCLARLLWTAKTKMKKLILLAEDNEDIRQITQMVLKSHGYEVSLAKNGLEAVEKATLEVPNLILMDIFMPVMDGIEAMSRIRSNRETKDIPIIALTATGRPQDTERCLAAGCHDFIGKPYSYRELIAVINNVLTNGVRTPPSAESGIRPL
jgi:CheY-like chemotaxis protein